MRLCLLYNLDHGEYESDFENYPPSTVFFCKINVSVLSFLASFLCIIINAPTM